jgi:glycosyltransferase involved in cell wall biosynthesis
MRIAWWSPLPPQPSGIANYSLDMLAALASRLEIVAVVDDKVAGSVQLPHIAVVGATAYMSGAAGRCDLDVYQMGNHPWFHGYMHQYALDHPGVLVLHDPALVDFYMTLCGGPESPLFLEEALYNDQVTNGAAPTIVVDGKREPDRLSLLMSRRLVEASLVTLVHSPWARDELERRFPFSQVSVLPNPAQVLCPAPESVASRQGEAVFGVFGGLANHKRIPSVLRAFAVVHGEFPKASLVIAGRSDDEDIEREVRLLIGSLAIEDAVTVLIDEPIEVLERQIRGCDVAVALRWPSAGETSSVVVRALAAGKPVIVSDLPQYRHFDPTYCWTVPTEPDGERRRLIELMQGVLSDPTASATAGQSARSFVESTQSFSHACDRYIEVIEECARPANPQRQTGEAPFSDSCAPGANIIGDWWATTGLAEAARRSATALIEANVSISVVNIPVVNVPREEDRAPDWLWSLPHGRMHPVDIWYLNVNELYVVPDDELRPSGTDRYLIASWFWELPRIGPEFACQVDRIDEIWVGSRFVADTFRGHTHKPVVVIPCVIEPTPSPSVTRSDFGLPEDACVFLFSLDANSFFARKNPWGTIRAFHEAFGPRERRGSARLVIKTVNLDRHPRERARLVATLAQVDGILIEDDLPRDDMHALISLCDVYVSLHRSEGFGLGMAEAMYLGRPVIATAYSGNMDFTTETNSCLIGYRLRAIDAAENEYDPGLARVYEAGQLWAEPNLEQAARWMRTLFERPTERQRIGASGAATIRQKYNTGAAQTAMLTRLKELAHARSG